MEYYFTDISLIDSQNSQLMITGDEFKHLTKVLRKKCDDAITVTDGLYNIYDCIIINIKSDSLICKIIKSQKNLYEPSNKIRLYIAQLKNSERFEFAIEKCVELGVFEITPVVTRYSEKKEKFNETKIKRFSKIIKSAAMQSQRCFIPKIHNSITFNELIEESENLQNKIVMYEFSDKNSRIEGGYKNDYIALLIGPEGGFSTEEIEKLKENNWSVKSLGERKLRAETAAIVSVFQILNN